MGCASGKQQLVSKHLNPRRKFSVYFPASSSGVQNFSKQECKQMGIQFEDIQAIFNKDQNNFDESTIAPLGSKGSSVIQPNQCQNSGSRYQAPLKRGDEDDNLALNNDLFKNFDFNQIEAN